jgi:hypothetical protein
MALSARASTPMKNSLWALKPNATKYERVAISNEEVNEIYKNHYLSLNPGSTFKIAKKQPTIN